jgi:hypothetical protein
LAGDHRTSWTLREKNPEQLTNDPLEADVLERVCRKLALRAHLEARQADDIWNDLARNVKPSEGPFTIGERAIYWDLDKAKFSKGVWKKGKVIAVNGPMVTIEHDGGVSRISESKLRKDHDPWHDNPLPPVLEEGRMLNPAGERPPAEPPPGLPEREEEKGSQQAVVAADSLWVVKHQGKINFLEIVAGAAVGKRDLLRRRNGRR